MSSDVQRPTFTRREFPHSRRPWVSILTLPLVFLLAMKIEDPAIFAEHSAGSIAYLLALGLGFSYYSWRVYRQHLSKKAIIDGDILTIHDGKESTVIDLTAIKALVDRSIIEGRDPRGTAYLSVTLGNGDVLLLFRPGTFEYEEEFRQMVSQRSGLPWQKIEKPQLPITIWPDTDKPGSWLTRKQF